MNYFNVANDNFNSYTVLNHVSRDDMVCINNIRLDHIKTALGNNYVGQGTRIENKTNDDDTTDKSNTSSDKRVKENEQEEKDNSNEES